MDIRFFLSIIVFIRLIIRIFVLIIFLFGFAVILIIVIIRIRIICLSILKDSNEFPVVLRLRLFFRHLTQNQIVIRHIRRFFLFIIRIIQNRITHRKLVQEIFGRNLSRNTLTLDNDGISFLAFLFLSLCTNLVHVNRLTGLLFNFGCHIIESNQCIERQGSLLITRPTLGLQRIAQIMNILFDRGIRIDKYRTNLVCKIYKPIFLFRHFRFHSFNYFKSFYLSSILHINDKKKQH